MILPIYFPVKGADGKNGKDVSDRGFPFKKNTIDDQIAETSVQANSQGHVSHYHELRSHV